MPKDSVQSQINRIEVARLISKLVDPEVNGALGLLLLLDLPVKDHIVYQEDISKVLRRPEVEGLMAGGVVSPDSELSGFRCVTQKTEDGKNKTHVLIMPIPLIYELEDISVLSGIIVHELRHALDKQELTEENPEEDYTNMTDEAIEIDVGKYAKNILECRAHAEQARHMIEIFDSGEKAKAALQKSLMAKGMIPSIRESMMMLIDLLCQKNESVLELEPETISPIQQQKTANQVIDILFKIIKVFKFSNYIVRKSSY